MILVLISFTDSLPRKLSGHSIGVKHLEETRGFFIYDIVQQFVKIVIYLINSECLLKYNPPPL